MRLTENDMETVNIGVIGCGSMGVGVVRQLLACDNRLRVTAVYDLDSRSVEKAKAEIGTAFAVCSDYHEVLNMPDLHWVMIASWNCYHAEPDPSFSRPDGRTGIGRDLLCHRRGDGYRHGS